MPFWGGEEWENGRMKGMNVDSRADTEPVLNLSELNERCLGVINLRSKPSVYSHSQIAQAESKVADFWQQWGRWNTDPFKLTLDSLTNHDPIVALRVLAASPIERLNLPSEQRSDFRRKAFQLLVEEPNRALSPYNQLTILRLLHDRGLTKVSDLVTNAQPGMIKMIEKVSENIVVEYLAIKEMRVKYSTQPEKKVPLSGDLDLFFTKTITQKSGRTTSLWAIAIPGNVGVESPGISMAQITPYIMPAYDYRLNFHLGGGRNIIKDAQQWSKVVGGALLEGIPIETKVTSPDKEDYPASTARYCTYTDFALAKYTLMSLKNMGVVGEPIIEEGKNGIKLFPFGKGEAFCLRTTGESDRGEINRFGVLDDFQTIASELAK